MKLGFRRVNKLEEYLAEQEQYKGHTIKIYQDPEPIDPRDGGHQDNFGTMVCFHKRYNLGDEHGLISSNFDGWSELEGYLIKELDAAVALPLYVYDHSGITIRTAPFSCPWDSGQVGFIYATRQNIRNNYGVKRIWRGTLERATKLLESEVEEYDRYLTGQVYGYRIEDADGEDADSCWGYSGEPSEIISECKGIIDKIINEELVPLADALTGGEYSKRRQKHYPKVDVFVTRGMQFRASIRESIISPTYEVTIGGEEWNKGKGRNHQAKIQEQMNKILRALEQGYARCIHAK